MSTPKTSVKRPGLIWFTLILVTVVALVSTFGAVQGMLLVPTVWGSVPAWRLIAGLSLSITIVCVFWALLVGVWKRAVWAYWGSVCFGILVLVMIVHSKINGSNGPAPVFEIAPNQLLGAALAEISIYLLAVIYPLRLYFSKAVRAYYHRSGVAAIDT